MKLIINDYCCLNNKPINHYYLKKGIPDKVKLKLETLLYFSRVKIIIIIKGNYDDEDELREINRMNKLSN